MTKNAAIQLVIRMLRRSSPADGGSVTIIGKTKLKEFRMIHSDARRPLERWLQLTEGAEWRSYMDIRQTFHSADSVPPHTVFNIGGNKYRLTAKVDYSLLVVQIVKVETHEENGR